MFFILKGASAPPFYLGTPDRGYQIEESNCEQYTVYIYISYYML